MVLQTTLQQIYFRILCNAIPNCRWVKYCFIICIYKYCLGMKVFVVNDDQDIFNLTKLASIISVTHGAIWFKWLKFNLLNNQGINKFCIYPEEPCINCIWLLPSWFWTNCHKLTVCYNIQRFEDGGRSSK